MVSCVYLERGLVSIVAPFGRPQIVIRIEQVGPIRKFQLGRTLFGRELYITAAYWVDGLQVDTGCAHTVGELVDALSDMPVVRIVNTHSHEDHVAANAALQAKYGAEILAHPMALPVLATPEKQRLRPYQLVMWGRPVPSRGREIGDVVETEHYKFEVIHTPGHSPDHICVYERDRGWLFTGDLYIGGKDRALRADYNIWEIIESLKLIANLDVELLFPGSGTVRERPHEELLSKIAYLEDMGGRVLDLHCKGWSRRRIRRTLFGAEMSIAYITLGHFSGRNLVRSYLEDAPAGPGEDCGMSKTDSGAETEHPRS
jgi:glyoxylase-like metal-dependent hydrolase (beta-lactamase superfamily II)